MSNKIKDALLGIAFGVVFILICLAVSAPLRFIKHHVHTEVKTDLAGIKMSVVYQVSVDGEHWNNITQVLNSVSTTNCNPVELTRISNYVIKVYQKP